MPSTFLNNAVFRNRLKRSSDRKQEVIVLTIPERNKISFFMTTSQISVTKIEQSLFLQKSSDGNDLKSRQTCAIVPARCVV